MKRFFLGFLLIVIFSSHVGAYTTVLVEDIYGHTEHPNIYEVSTEDVFTNIHFWTPTGWYLLYTISQNDTVGETIWIDSGYEFTQTINYLKGDFNFGEYEISVINGFDDGTMSGLWGGAPTLVPSSQELGLDGLVINSLGFYLETYDVYQTFDGEHIMNIHINGDLVADVSLIPIPPTILLLGTSLIGLVGLRKKLKK
jgi:hypothetical protein